jgi:hypothetical protein
MLLGENAFCGVLLRPFQRRDDNGSAGLFVRGYIGASVVPCSAALIGELLDHGPDPQIPTDEPVAPKANTDPNTGPNIPNTPNTAASARAELRSAARGSLAGDNWQNRWPSA